MAKFLVDWDPNPNEEQGYANGGAVASGILIAMVYVVGLAVWKYGEPIWRFAFGA